MTKSIVQQVFTGSIYFSMAKFGLLTENKVVTHGENMVTAKAYISPKIVN